MIGCFAPCVENTNLNEKTGTKSALSADGKMIPCNAMNQIIPAARMT